MSHYNDCQSQILYGRYGRGNVNYHVNRTDYGLVHGGNSAPQYWDYVGSSTYKSPYVQYGGYKRRYKRKGRGIITDTLKSAYHHIKRPVGRFIRKSVVPFAKGVINSIMGSKPESYLSVRERMLNGGRRKKRRSGRGIPPRCRNWGATRLGLRYPKGYTSSKNTYIGGHKRLL